MGPFLHRYYGLSFLVLRIQPPPRIWLTKERLSVDICFKITTVCRFRLPGAISAAQGTFIGRVQRGQVLYSKQTIF